ncbi:MAG: 3-keto-5-aminohexanoate cleavage protein [Deltaproteobacteria bacterium]|nr:3-keto-5-aminohexanoate cleavage protein [Deltaproteobacteria bacterium]
MKIPKLIIQVAVTGADTTPSQTPYVPITPDEITEECYKCWKAGASMVHLHVREPDTGKPSGDQGLWETLLKKVKRKCGDLVIGVSSGGAYGLTVEQRLATVINYQPEIASLTPESVSNTLHHVIPRVKEWKYDWEKDYLMSTTKGAFVNTFEDIMSFARIMRENGTKPEMEFFSTAGLYNTRMLWRDGLIDEPIAMQWVLGVAGGTGGYPSEVVHMQTEALRHFGPDKFQWSVIGVGYPRQYTLGALAISMFGHVRVGLEDNIYVRKGQLCKSNVEMVEDIKTIAEIFGREIASPDEAREMLGLKGYDKVNF